MAEYNLPEPVFQNRRNEFVVTLYNRTTVVPKEETTNSDETSLLEFCRTPRSRQEIADHLKIKATPYMMNKYVLPLIEKGLLLMTIPDRPRSRNQKYYTAE